MHTAQRLLTGADDFDQDRPSARPATVTVYGPKGLGEGGAMAPAAVITNEVRDMLLALRGVEINGPPLTPQWVRAGISWSSSPVRYP
jgi:carbon-monoxide dehydrogenase large subunit